VTLGLTTQTWYGILEMAEEFGWNPMGTILPGREADGMTLAGFGPPDAHDWAGEYWSDNGDRRLVLFEDALNLADALGRATLNYEPQYIPSLHYYTLFGEHNGSNGTQPSLGAIQGVIDLCYQGSFQIEKF
jgi:hypothetical protein